uniref:Uncharacterized protein n=1 Tax=Glossina pallidipes TaxID=7398 RepID=A0A1B0A6V2_GLOPL
MDDALTSRVTLQMATDILLIGTAATAVALSIFFPYINKTIRADVQKKKKTIKLLKQCILNCQPTNIFFFPQHLILMRPISRTRISQVDYAIAEHYENENSATFSIYRNFITSKPSYIISAHIDCNSLARFFAHSQAE